MTDRHFPSWVEFPPAQNQEAFLEPDRGELLDHMIYQERCLGYDLLEVARKFETTADDIQEATERVQLRLGILSPRSVNTRKALALARLDGMSKALMSGALQGNIGDIKTYLLVQEREAKLTGMDSPVKQEGVLTIEVPWLTKDRLSYRNAAGEPVQNVTDITSIIQVKQAAAEPWKEPPEGDAAALRKQDNWHGS